MQKAGAMLTTALNLESVDMIVVPRHFVVVPIGPDLCLDHDCRRLTPNRAAPSHPFASRRRATPMIHKITEPSTRKLHRAWRSRFQPEVCKEAKTKVCPSSLSQSALPLPFWLVSTVKIQIG